MVELTEHEKAVYAWQIASDGFDEAAQQRLKNSSVLVSRTGGIGCLVAYELAAAGIGKLVIAHSGHVKPSDLNRQLLMTHDWLGKPRIESSVARLKELNPRLEIVACGQAVSEDNADELVGQVDLVVDGAPLFEERYAMNRAAIEKNIPVVEAAMYDLEGTVTSIKPGQTPCIACLHPDPSDWKREFPVFGAMAGTLGCIAAMEAIKILTGLGDPLFGRLLTIDLRHVAFRTLEIARNPACKLCGHLPYNERSSEST